jgi:ATP-binding cassette, subfamily B (MDR/TAP), member 1
LLTDQGYQTEVGEAAGLLSGGQRQRIAIARSIVSNPKILLLDEATSALDPRAEGVVQRALDRVSVNRTTLVIAHKLATVKDTDNIAVISDGQVVEQGTHDELLRSDGRYARLVEAQSIEERSNTTTDVSEIPHEDPEKDLIRQISSFKPTTMGKSSTTAEPEPGTLGYSLIRCIFLMFLEQKSLYGYFFLSMIACLIAGAVFPGQALIFSRIFVVFTLPPHEGQPKADFYSLMFFVIALGCLVAYFIIGITCNIIGQEVTHRYRKELFSNMLRQDMDFFNLLGNTSGALTSKLSTMPTQLQDLISANILLIFVIFVSVASTSVLALAYGWKLGLVVVFGGLPALILSGYLRIRLETILDAKNSERFAEGANLANEAVMAIKTVASLTLESSILRRYQDLMSGIVRNSIRSLLWTIFWYALSQSLEFLVMALGFWYGSKLLSEGEYTSTQFYIIFLGTLFAGQSAAMFFSYSTSITQAVEAANYILWLRTCIPVMEENDENRNKGPDLDKGDIVISSMSFRYPRRENRVIKDISMEIQSGQFVAFVGPSGCGKSTIVSLLERFYDPTSGQIKYAGSSISTYSPRLYRQNISLVQQEPTLYSGSLRENITLGVEGDATEEEILEACRQANALEFIDSLPEGLSTACGNRGLQFSGGQKQRIAIARALIRKPRLLLLDEATSALDTQSERIVQSALDRAKEGRTTIAVAHRLSTIVHADVIFVFGDGRIVEQGTHQELVARKGRYYEMVLAQSLNRDV